MAKCPHCSAQFLNEKLLDIHTKYCKEKVSPDTSGSGYSTEKLWRSDLLAAVEETPVDKAIEELKKSEASGHKDFLSNSSAIRPLPIEDSAIHVSKGLPLHSSELSSTDTSGTVDDFYEKSRERLKFSIKPYGNILIVKIKGDLVVWTSIYLNKALAKLLTSGKTLFALDVSEVKECDATGLGALFLFHQELKDKEGALALCASEQQQTKFDIIKGFTSAISFYPNIEAAVKELLKKEK